MFGTQKPTPTNRELAAALFNVATLLRDGGGDPYRVRAYRNAARALMRRNAAALAAPLRDSKDPLPHPRGVLGARVQKRLKEYAETGRMELLEELCEGLPPHIGALMQAPGVGPRTAQRLHDTLGIETPAQLQAAARQGRLQSVWGVGPKRQAQIAQLSLFDETPEPTRLAA